MVISDDYKCWWDLTRRKWWDFDLTKESGDFILPARIEIYLDFMEFTGMGQWLTMIF